MSIAFDLDLEVSYFLLLLAATIIGSVVEWRRGGNDVQELRERVGLMEHTKTDVEDWNGINVRLTVMEELVNKLIREWSGDDGGEDD